MEASQHSLLAACFTLHSINATLAIVPQRGAGLWITTIFDLIFSKPMMLVSRDWEIDDSNLGSTLIKLTVALLTFPQYFQVATYYIKIVYDHFLGA
jgi:hypothetical protein